MREESQARGVHHVQGTITSRKISSGPEEADLSILLLAIR
jgi:hypothetical protein